MAEASPAPPSDGEGGASSPCATPGCGEPQRAVCDATVPHYEEGQRVDEICLEELGARGLTLVDLSEGWAPRVLDGGGTAGPVPYRERYLDIAAERFGDDDTWLRELDDRYHELYGIFPTPKVVAARLAEDARHACHDAVPREGLESLAEGVDTWRPLANQRADHIYRKSLERQLGEAARKLGLEGIDALAGHPELGARQAVYAELSIRHEAIAEAQAHFRCEGLLGDGEGEPGILDGATIGALQGYLRRHMAVTWQIDGQARDLLLADSRELDFLTLLRSLRERVVDELGLVEDGTARGELGTVVGRRIDTTVFVESEGRTPLPLAAPDLVSEATDAAARALGWTSPDAARRFFADGAPERVAIPLPPVPSYHGPHMELSLVIDRGDVWYDFPFVPNGDRRLQPREELPKAILYAKSADGWVALSRWPTTIGGWQPERLGNGQLKLVYKESPPGPRVVRDLVAAPRWIPPSSTPMRDLVRPKVGGGWALRHDIMGPSYASAYGLAMLVHQRVDEMEDGREVLTDQGIRTHGSVSYASILEGFSHGCHRLHNHRAVRLAGFLLAHRRHEARGEIPLDFHRSFVWRNRRYEVAFDSRGYRYELTPPLPVEVLEGRVRGAAKSPQPPRGLTRPMLQRYR
ncbi:MAG: hypothetical protein R3B72_29040 [Polyangiaceae bacterium]